MFKVKINGRFLIILSVFLMLLIMIPSSFATDLSSADSNSTKDWSFLSSESSVLQYSDEQLYSNSNTKFEISQSVNDCKSLIAQENSNIAIDNLDNGTNNILSENEYSIYVSTGGSDDTGDGSESNPYASIANAINQMTDDKNIIRVADGIYKESALILKSNTSIIGESQNGTIIDGEFNDYIIATDYNLVLQSLTLTHGICEGDVYGAALSVGANGNVTVQNCSFIDNLAYGGTAIYNSGTLIINQSYLSGNQAIDCDGGAILAIGGSKTIVYNSVFSNNSAISGGTIKVSNAILYVYNSVFINNSGNSSLDYSSGGAIDIDGIGNITNSLFADNDASNGGALSVSGTVIVDNCTFDNNTADNGGAIENYNGTLNLRNSTFVNNSANEGGAIYHTLNYLNLEGNSFFSNEARNGGVLYINKTDDEDYIVNIHSSLFENNTAFENGSVIYANNDFTANFNAFVNNHCLTDEEYSNSSVIYSLSSDDADTDIEYNWWANNTPDWENILIGIDDPQSFMVLNTSYENSGNNSFSIIGKLYWNGTDNQTGTDKIPNRLLTLSASNGTLELNESYFNGSDFSTAFKNSGWESNITIKMDNELQFLLIQSDIEGIVVVNHTGNDTLDIQYAIDIANPGDIVFLRDNYQYVVNHVNVTKNITILAGENVTVSSENGSDCMFYIVPILGDENFTSGGENISFINIVFSADNDDVLILAKAENITEPLSDITTITIINNTICKSNDGVVAGSVVVLRVECDTENFNPTGTITISNNTIASGIKLFELWNNNWGNESEVVINTTPSISTILYIREISNTEGKVVVNLQDTNGKYLVDETVISTISFVDSNETISKSLTVNDEGNAILTDIKQNATIKFEYLGNSRYKNSTAVLNFTYAPIKINTKFEYESSVLTFNSSLLPVVPDIEITLKDINGTPLPNKTVYFEYGGVLSSTVTDKYGIANCYIIFQNGSNITLALCFLGDTQYNPVLDVAVIPVNYTDKIVTRLEYSDIHSISLIYLNKTNSTIIGFDNDTLSNMTCFTGGLLNMTIIDENNRTLQYPEVSIAFNDTIYNLTADYNGFIQLAIPFSFGEYNSLTVTYDGDKNYDGFYETVHITSPKKITKISFNNMTTYAVLNNERNGQWFNATLQNFYGAPIANKTIYIGFNGKVYTRTTDENGSVSLQINIGYQSANTFSLTFLGDEEYQGNVSVALIVVYPQITKLTTKTYTYKSSAKTKTLKATLTLSNGTAVKNQKITFNINNKTYIATTNSNGVATIKISLSSKKTYTYTASFAGNNQYAKTSSTNKLIIK